MTSGTAPTIALALTLAAACAPHPDGRGCPAGAYRESIVSEDPYTPVRCLRRDGTPDGPFLFHDFDEVRRSWSTRTGTYVDGRIEGDVIVRDGLGRISRVERYEQGERVAVARYRPLALEERTGPGEVALTTHLDGEVREIRSFVCRDGVPADIDGDPRPPAEALELLACAAD